MSLDIKDFYLGSELPTSEYAWGKLTQILASTRVKYGVDALAGNRMVLAEITGGMHDLSQAEALSSASGSPRIPHDFDELLVLS